MSVSSAGSQFVQTSAARKRRDRIMRGTLMVGTGVALVPLILVIYYLIYKGVGSWSGSFFTTDPNGNFFGNPGGIRSAIFGTLEIVAVASAIAIPVGIAVALYLTEYGKDGWFANLVRYFVDVMTGVPSVVFGLFIYIVLVISHAGGSGFAGWKGSLALALLMLPIVIRSSEVVLQLVPGSLREAALALGAPRWRIVWRVVLPTARSGARHWIAAGDCARDGGDRPAAVHRLAGDGSDREPQRPDEQPAAADLHRHHEPARRDRRRGPGARRSPWSPWS